MTEAHRIAGEEAGHDPDLPGRRHACAGDRAAARQAAGGRRAHPGEGRLHRRAARLGQGQGEERVASRTRGHFAKAKVEPKAKLVEFRVDADALLEPGADAVGGAFRGRPDRRCVRHHQGQGLRRRHEALEFLRPRGQPRRVDQPSQPGLDRQSAGSRQDLQEQEDGRPSRRRARDHAQPGGRRGRCREGPADDQGRGARCEGRLRAGARRGEARAAGRRAVSGGAGSSCRRRAERCRSKSPRSTTALRRQRRAAGRDFRREAARRHHGARGALAAGQAPRRHAQGQGHERGVRARRRSRTARRAPATRARAACARRSSARAAWCMGRWCARTSTT